MVNPKVFVLVGLIIMILSSILAYMTYNEAYSLRLKQEYMYTGVYGDTPIDLFPYNGRVYILSSTTSGDIALYKLSSNGNLYWRITWGYKDLIPLGIFYQYDHIVTAATTTNRHILLLRTYSPLNGALIDNRSINLSSIYWIFSNDLLPRYAVIGGARYVAGLKLQNFIMFTDIFSGKNEWTKIWGGREVDSILMLTHNDLGVIYLSMSGKDVFIGMINYNGRILWNRTLGEIRVVGLRTSGYEAYILAYNPAPVLYQVDTRTGSILTTYLNFLSRDYPGLNLTAFDINENGTVVLGGYYGSYPEKGVVLLTSISQLRKGHISTRIIISSRASIIVTTVRLTGNELLVGGTASGTLFVALYGYTRNGEWYLVLLPIASLISGVILIVMAWRRTRSKS